jgi:hypothetical protein
LGEEEPEPSAAGVVGLTMVGTIEGLNMMARRRRRRGHGRARIRVRGRRKRH